MAGKRVIPASILLLVSALLLLFIGPGSGVKATSYDTTYAVVLSDNTPGANADQTTVYNITVTDVNFAQILSATGDPSAQIALDSEIPDGSSVGSIINATNLSVFNGPCSTPITVTIPFMDCTTDTLDEVPWIGSGDNLVQDNDNDMNEDGTAAPNHDGNCIDGIDNGDGDGLADGLDPDCNKDGDVAGTPVEAKDTNGIPSYCDHYPDFLNDTYSDVRPRARYVGHQVVVADAPATQLEFVIFDPGALAGDPTVVGQMGDTFGFIDFVVLNNPIAPVSPSTITDFCVPLQSIPTLLGQTDGSYTVTPGPEPYEVDRVGQCDGADNDADGYIDDGCLVKSSAGPYYVRNENPPAHTGLFGTGTHAIRTYSMSQRDVDNDGVSNNLDSCPYTANTGVDADGDGLDSACDPNDGSPSAGAPAPNGVDDDSDTLTDEDWVDNADNDGDTLVDEDGECKATSGLPDEDQDCYPNRQDNCPLTANNQSDTDNPPGSAAADLGFPLDAIGDACDASPTTADGHYHVAMPITYTCIPDPNGGDDWDGDGDSDNDDDGVCDSTEILLGSDKDVAASTPEHEALDLAIATGTAAEAPGTCSDYTTYNHPDAGPIDNDGDTLTNAADPDCQSPGDTDKDMVDDLADNCPNDKNPEQVDSDGDGVGDECDTDIDGDGVSNANEICMGLDPKDNSADSSSDDANPYDFDNNTVVDVTDALTFLAKFPSAVTNPGDPRFDYDCNRVVDVTDALIFLAKFPSDTKITHTFTNNTGGAVDDIHIEFSSAITKVASASGGWGPTGAVSPPSALIDLSGGALANGGTLTVTLVGNRPPVVRCYDWTVGGAVVNGSDQPCRLDTSTDGLHFGCTNPLVWSAVYGPPGSNALSLNIIPDTAAPGDRWHTLNKDVPPPVTLTIQTWPKCGPYVWLATGENGAWDPLPFFGAPTYAEMSTDPGKCTGAGEGADHEGDGFNDDGCDISPAGSTVGEIDPCWNPDEDDGDSPDAINDGCPTVAGAPETVCNEPYGTLLIDNDFDGWINDGCPAVGGTSEAPGSAVDQCDDATNDDAGADGDINDGCRPRDPARGWPW